MKADGTDSRAAKLKCKNPAVNFFFFSGHSLSLFPHTFRENLISKNSSTARLWSVQKGQVVRQLGNHALSLQQKDVKLKISMS